MENTTVKVKGEKHPHVLDFYFAEHHGLWILRSSNDDWDLAEYDTKSDMLLELVNH